MLLIMIPDQYPNYMYYKAVEIYTEYFDSLDWSHWWPSGNNERLMHFQHKKNHNTLIILQAFKKREISLIHNIQSLHHTYNFTSSKTNASSPTMSQSFCINTNTFRRS